MQTTSQTWKDLLAVGAPLEARATIGGTVVTAISQPVITRACMQESMGIGNVAAASLALAVRGTATIPRSASVFIETRLNDGETASEWLPQGTFYIARRSRDPVTEAVALECYDALLKANAVWEPSAGSWPRAMGAVLAELLALLELTLDSRSAIPSGAPFAIAEPAAGTTIRDVLGVIAQAGGGNWIVTPENRLRLVPLADAAGAAAATADAVDVDGVTGGMDVGPTGTITGVRSTVDGVVTLTGDETGIVVDVSIAPVIAAELAEALIGRRYQAYSLDGAVCDPAAELGDYVRAGAGGEIASVLYGEQLALGPACRCDVSAPQAGEVTDEYPYIGGTVKALTLAKAYADEAVEALDSDLTQQEIFNRLTDNGAAQGLVLYNGQLYINASYINAGYLSADHIQGGTLTLGGQNNQNGVLRMLNANGDEIGHWNNNGIAINAGAINLTKTEGNKEGSIKIQQSLTNQIEIRYSDETSARLMTFGGINPINIIDSNSNDQMVITERGIFLNTTGGTIFSVYQYAGVKYFTYNGDYFNINADVHLYQPLEVGSGGTGATTAAGARTNLGITPANIGARPDTEPVSGNWFRGTPIIGNDGVMEIGKYIDFHASNATTADYDVRITANTTGLTLSGTTTGTFSGTLTGNVTGNCSGSSGSCTGNAASATALKDRTNNTLTYANYGASAISSDAVTDLTCWNGYELRSINKSQVFMRYAWWNSADSHDANTDIRGGIVFAYKNDKQINTATNGTLVDFSCGANTGYPLQIQGDYGGNKLYFRNRNGDNNTWGSWKRIVTNAETIAVDHGGTGATTAAGARANLGVPEIVATSSQGLQASLRFTGANGHSYGLGIFGKGQSYKIGLYDNTSNEWAWRI